MKKLLFLLVGFAVFASCSDHKDLFDSDRVKEEAKENFPVKDIDPNQDWNMMAVRTLDVTINAQTGATYTVKVLTDNPFKTENDAHVLAVAKVKDGTTANLKFDAPLAMKYVYVMRQQGDRDCVVTVATFENDKFVTAFGRSTAPRAVSARATNITIDNLPENADFICPNGATKVTADDLGNLKGGGYYIEDAISTGDLKLDKNTRLYIKSGAQLTLTADLNLNNGIIIVCEGGRLVTPENMSGKLSFQLMGGSIYNRGRIELNLDNEGWATISNQKSRLINEGTLVVNGAGINISGGDLYTGSGAVVQTISTVINNGKWVNDGYYLSQEYFTIQAQSEVQNNCRLVIFDGPFTFNAGNSGLNNTGYVSCHSASFSKGTLSLAVGSIFEVLEIATFKKDFTINGMQANNSQAPLLWIQEAAWENNNTSGLQIDKTIKISCYNDFFDKMPDLQLVDATINEAISNSCNPGYEQKEPDTEPTAAVFTYVYEDITTKAGDYDFNDVVLYVSVPTDNEEITVTLVAAGAANDLWVKYDFGFGYKGNLFEGEEVHEAMGQPAGTLINTNGSLSVKTQEWKIDELPKDFKLTNNGDIYIVDRHGNEVHPFVEKGGVPFALRIPGKWDFPKERTLIDKKYPEFGEWGASYKQKEEWYKHPAF